MIKLLEIAHSILDSVETAAELDIPENPSVDEQVVAYYRAQLIRANSILDKKRDQIFNDVLDLNTRGQIERALEAYDKDYLLGLGLSMEASSDLANALISRAKQYPVSIPDDWKEIAGMNVDLEGNADSTTPPRSLRI